LLSCHAWIEHVAWITLIKVGTIYDSRCQKYKSLSRKRVWGLIGWLAARASRCRCRCVWMAGRLPGQVELVLKAPPSQAYYNVWVETGDFKVSDFKLLIGDFELLIGGSIMSLSISDSKSLTLKLPDLNPMSWCKLGIEIETQL
jgi:hypothetical protein